MTTRPTPRSTAPKVDLDLTALDTKPSKPLTVKVADNVVIRLIDARDLDWQDAAGLSVDRPFQLVTAIVHPDDQDAFLAVKGITARQLDAIVGLYRTHFGLGDEGESPAS